jgi:hypothetical protein
MAKDKRIFIHNDSSVDGRLAGYFLSAEYPTFPLNHLTCSVDAVNEIVSKVSNVQSLDMSITGNYDLVFLGIDVPRNLNVGDFNTVTYVSRNVEESPKIRNLDSLQPTANSNTRSVSRTCSLYAWGIVSPKQAPKYLQDLDAYYSGDTNSSSVKRGKALAQLLSFVRKEFDFKETLRQIEDSHGHYLVMKGLPIIQVLDQVAGALVDESYEMTIFGKTTRVINSPKVFNEFIRERLIEDVNSLLLYQDVKGQRMWTLQINNEPTLLSTIAECFNGSVHSNFSGWVTPMEITPEMLSQIWSEYGSL